MKLTKKQAQTLCNAYDNDVARVHLKRRVNNEECMGCALFAELAKKPAERNAKFLERCEKALAVVQS